MLSSHPSTKEIVGGSFLLIVFSLSNYQFVLKLKVFDDTKKCDVHQVEVLWSVSRSGWILRLQIPRNFPGFVRGYPIDGHVRSDLASNLAILLLITPVLLGLF